MKIKEIKIGKIDIPLKRKYKLPTREITTSEEVVIKIITDTGEIGYGSAAPAPMVTGETENSIIGAIRYIEDYIKGMEISSLESIIATMEKVIRRNPSAKAAIDIALYDLAGKKYNEPLYKFLGGNTNFTITDTTIMNDSIENMAKNSLEAMLNGYADLKIKLGYGSFEKDIEILQAIKKSIRKSARIRIDGSGAWSAKEAIKIIRKCEEIGLDIDFVEQPVKYWDIEGLKQVKDSVDTMILADESVFGYSSAEAFRVIKNRTCDYINLKLMKSGGIHNAIKIYNMAETMDIKCMMGCMIESKIGITAAASMAMAKDNMITSDLDTMLIFEEDPIVGGATFEKNKIILNDEPGLGIKEIKGWKEIK
ncbi:dipeptide epimerase [Clostridium sp. CTA-19]